MKNVTTPAAKEASHERIIVDSGNAIAINDKGKRMVDKEISEEICLLTHKIIGDGRL